jgi:hypothetical protein
MEKQKTITGLAIVLGAMLLLLGGIIGAYGFPTEKVIYTNQTVLVDKEVVVGNVTGLANEVADIKATVNEDKDWENAAFVLATSEWSNKDNKDIFNAINNDLNGSIEDKEDITSIVVTDTTVVSSDVDDKNSKVEQTLKVKYEDKDGDNKKMYILVTTTIKDNDVEDQKFELA